MADESESADEFDVMDLDVSEGDAVDVEVCPLGPTDETTTVPCNVVEPPTAKMHTPTVTSGSALPALSRTRSKTDRDDYDPEPRQVGAAMVVEEDGGGTRVEINGAGSAWRLEEKDWRTLLGDVVSVTPRNKNSDE